ncbi:Uu.00g018520.m01.CDS01 [Anthostomella pinea]|uniref:beta-galactosidase n=1 Tax=Anthostomella pinea TaxID=933095 RepID=A0AAI8VZ40_9PEZI|nr:Uu.00g018520.m01.CDS01 [Anthostomella pinea]
MLSSLIYTLALARLSLGAAANASFTPDASRWPGGMHLGTDYYPSQWPESLWESDFAAMQAANISYVRVSEFDWSVLEPAEGEYNFTLLDTTLELMGKYGLKAIVGTPTASPPNWVSEKYDINFVDRTNRTLLFGSRRGYSFSSFDYRDLSQKITTELAKRYGNNSNVVAWQLDNEFGCHDTVRTYDHNAMVRFRTWLRQKYGTIEAMNDAQGRVFWSTQYKSFDAVQPPFLEIYTLNEAHTLDWYKFSSDMVIDFAKEQTAILRQYAPRHAITTNFQMMFTDFDHYKFNREVGLDLATYDQYALAGLTAVAGVTDQQMQEYLRTGLPDLQMLHQDLYRGISGAAYGKNSGPYGIMEMEPGVLNWGQYRVSPAVGMVRLWSLETFAAEGSMVNYFRWRQVPYAQEQTLSGLHVSDGTPDEGFEETQIVAQEDLPKVRSAMSMSTQKAQADVALVFDYISHWVFAIEPYSGSWSVDDAGYTDTTVAYTDLVYNFYSALRRLGLSIDVVSPEQALDGYKMVVVPSLPIIPDAFNAALANLDVPVVFGPHTGSKTENYAYPAGLTPSAGALRDRLPMRVTRVETPPDYAGSGVAYAGANYSISAWEETVVCSRQNSTSKATVTSTSRHRLGKPAACASDDGVHYLAFKPPVEFLVSYLGDVASSAGVRDGMGRVASQVHDLGEALRLTRRGDLLWAFNYGMDAQSLPPMTNGTLVVGASGNSNEMPAYGVKVWNMAR